MFTNNSDRFYVLGTTLYSKGYGMNYVSYKNLKWVSKHGCEPNPVLIDREDVMRLASTHMDVNMQHWFLSFRVFREDWTEIDISDFDRLKPMKNQAQLDMFDALFMNPLHKSAQMTMFSREDWIEPPSNFVSVNELVNAHINCKCKVCSTNVDYYDDSLIIDDIGHVCEECSSDDNYDEVICECHNCEKNIIKDENYCNSDNYYCASCWDDKEECADCGDRCNPNDMRKKGSEWICDSCVDNNSKYMNCNECGDLFEYETSRYLCDCCVRSLAIDNESDNYRLDGKRCRKFIAKAKDDIKMRKFNSGYYSSGVCGRFARFDHDESVGYKFYRSEYQRDDYLDRQTQAARYGVAPKVGPAFEAYDSDDVVVYGFITEAIECLGGNDDDDDFKIMCATLASLGYSDSDMHDGNFGTTYDGRTVCIDFSHT